MNDSERTVNEYLTGLELGRVVFEPDGNHPPDFLVNGRIAVEARRLNENEIVGGGHRGLEVTSKPLHQAVLKALAASGPADSTQSWFVHYSVRRPLPPWKIIETYLKDAVAEFRAHADDPPKMLRLGRSIRLEFQRASRSHDTLLLLGGYSDCDEGGFLVTDVIRNLRLCIAEKTKKVSRVRHKYSEWWLVLEDRIGYGALDADDVQAVRAELGPIEGFARVVLVNPLRPTQGLEVWRESAV